MLFILIIKFVILDALLAILVQAMNVLLAKQTDNLFMMIIIIIANNVYVFMDTMKLIIKDCVLNVI